MGYAPGGWTALLSHLRGLGYDDTVIEAAGLARRSSRGTFIDHFRDRVMLAIRDEHGTIAGFIGRAEPGSGPAVPKYLNSPETATPSSTPSRSRGSSSTPASRSGTITWTAPKAGGSAMPAGQHHRSPR
ncbi:MAG: hypothetical protein ACLP7J_00175 [Streptosporangiaceae bacterium]